MNIYDELAASLLCLIRDREEHLTLENLIWEGQGENVRIRVRDSSHESAKRFALALTRVQESPDFKEYRKRNE